MLIWMILKRYMAPVMATTDVLSFSVIRERTYPIFSGLIAAAIIFAVSPSFFAYADGHNWKIAALYEAGFEFAAVATSFLFTFYTFVVTAERGFIAKMRRTIYFQQLIQYTVTALILGTVLAVISIPMMVIEPLPQSRWDFQTCSIAAWAFVAVWTLAAFVRTTRVFIAFAAADL